MVWLSTKSDLMVPLQSIIVEFDLKHHTFSQVTLEDVVLTGDDNHKIYWIHHDLRQKDQFPALVSKLNLNDDVIQLCAEEDVMPRVIDADDSMTLQVLGLQTTELSTNDETQTSNLIIHLTDRFCFTACSETVEAIAEFNNTFPKAVKYAKTPCFIVFLILDDIINDYARVLFNFEILAEDLDTKIHKVHQSNYEHVMDVKLEVMKIKRYTVSVREILTRISGRSIGVISNHCRASLSNLANHAHMVVHEADSIRDILNGLLDQIDNALMQRMNETMRILTAFASIFLPLSLITGIYGMNFVWIPELSWKYGYFWALGLIVFCGTMLLVFFKWKKWF